MWEISWSLRITLVFERSDATSENRVKGFVGSGINLLMPKNPLTLQKIFIKFKKLLSN